ncbi:MAG: A/G-specific adenine glycosylase [Bacteroidetes bacterium]|nr:MAG: A/G-specific adenine glycosylase [Bacteroidota bacterium]
MAPFSKNPGYFARVLASWHRERNRRELPWKGEKDPYKIWLSEIILQQTRVEQGLNYYLSFVKTFPDVHKLASAPDKKVFKLWEGLGYYSRCRNLLASARYISSELKGEFPNTYDNIKTLKGVGPYTAAAISSFAFNLPHAVVDGNVFRVLARIFGINIPTDTTEGKKIFTELANKLLDKHQPGLHNQAIMDFGATVCKPLPLCDECVFKKNCFAYLNNKTDQFPVKEKKITIKKRWFYYLVMQHDDKIAIRQRTGKDIWQQLYEFPMVETGKEQTAESILSAAEKDALLKRKRYKFISISPVYKQQLSHQLIMAQFIQVRFSGQTDLNGRGHWVTKIQMNKYPFPKLINQFKGESMP